MIQNVLFNVLFTGKFAGKPGNKKENVEQEAHREPARHGPVAFLLCFLSTDNKLDSGAVSRDGC